MWLDSDKPSCQSNKEKQQYLTSVCGPLCTLRRVQEYEQARYSDLTDCRTNSLYSADFADDWRHSSGLGSSGLSSSGMGSPGLRRPGLSRPGSDSSVAVMGWPLRGFS